MVSGDHMEATSVDVTLCITLRGSNPGTSLKHCRQVNGLVCWVLGRVDVELT